MDGSLGHKIMLYCAICNWACYSNWSANEQK